MKVIDASYKILTPITGHELEFIEKIGRTCYHSEDKIKPGSAEPFVRRLVCAGHESVIEHVSLSVQFTVDRGVSHEMVRHRLASYTQESTRYCNYGDFEKYPDGVIFVRPCYLDEGSSSYRTWWLACQDAEFYYLQMVKEGCKPEEARAVLPNSTATILTVTANLREWKHIFDLRCAAGAHPQIREVMRPLKSELGNAFPEIFGDMGDSQ